jgi:hypothetical protein
MMLDVRIFPAIFRPISPTQLKSAEIVAYARYNDGEVRVKGPLSTILVWKSVVLFRRDI